MASTKIAVPGLRKEELKERVCCHFGRALYKVVDTETGRIDIFGKTAEHPGGTGKEPGLVEGTGVDLVPCSGIGPMGVNMFRGLGIRPFIGPSGTVQSTFEAFESGTPQEATDENTCVHRRGWPEGRFR